MKHLAFGFGGAGAIALALVWAERLLSPWLWALGLGLGQVLAPVQGHDAEVPEVDWGAVEREVAAADVPQEATGDDGVKGRKAKPKSAKPEGGALFVSAERVLALSKRARVPASRYVPASGKRPAGLQVAGVGGLGIGVRDGDVLTKVAGAEVRSSSAVISTVLKLRAQKATAISGEFWRGEERWQIVFEMPYLEPQTPAADSSESKPKDAGSAPRAPSPKTGAPARAPALRSSPDVTKTTGVEPSGREVSNSPPKP